MSDQKRHSAGGGKERGTVMATRTTDNANEYLYNESQSLVRCGTCDERLTIWTRDILTYGEYKKMVEERKEQGITLPADDPYEVTVDSACPECGAPFEIAITAQFDV